MLVAGHKAEDFSILAVQTPVLAQLVTGFLENYSIRFKTHLIAFTVHPTLEQDMLIASYKTEDFLIIIVLFRPCRTHIHPCTVGHQISRKFIH